jgi:transcriptional regulator with XRE-family HTH domain
VRKTTQKAEPLPAEIPGRLAIVGVTLYGKSWRRRLAEGLNISRSTLWQWLSGAGKRRDVDGDLIDLLDSERDAASERALQIAELRRRFMTKSGA